MDGEVHDDMNPLRRIRERARRAHARIVLPEGTPEADAVWRVIVDPIDGTRGLMYQKRSAWILTGVAPNRGKDLLYLN